MNIGFLGTGHITSSVIEGIFKSKLKIKKIYISPRNRPIAKKLSDCLNQDVFFLDSCVGENVIKKSKEIPNGSVLLLENLGDYQFLFSFFVIFILIMILILNLILIGI